MKRQIIIVAGVLCAFSSAIFISGCTTPKTPYLASSSTSAGQQGLANCNTFSVGAIASGHVEHPLSGANRESLLYVYFTNLNASFMGASSTMVFNRLSVSTAGTSQDPTPMLFSVGGANFNALTPAIAQSVSPLVILLAGTDVQYNVIQVTATINGAQTAANFLIPEFDADPLVYEADPSHPQSLWPLHPFYSQAGQGLDFVTMSNAFCFL